MLTNKSILITGGTGSLGKALTKHILHNYPNIKKLIILSRDEQKQFQMAEQVQLNLRLEKFKQQQSKNLHKATTRN